MAYTKAELEVTLFDVEDIITTSNPKDEELLPPPPGNSTGGFN